ncbi:MAG: ATP-binding protein [Sulfitobacter sp.]
MTTVENQNVPHSLNRPAGFAPSFTRTWSSGVRSNIGRRFALATISCSTFLAFFMTFVQLAADYRNERNLQIAALTEMENAILPALAESLWLLDDALIESQLTGIAQLEGVNSVEITEAEASYRVVGETEATSHRVELPILHGSHDKTENLGTLVIDANFVQIRNRVFNRALVVLVTNFLKTIGVACAILYIFQRLIGQNISKLANFASAYDPKGTGQRLKLEASSVFGTRDENCEFLALEHSVNQWAEATETYVEQLLLTNREQAEFTYAISHDLKSPTNTMGMLIRELEEEGGVGDEGQDILEDMYATNSRMGDLVVDVLEYSRLIDTKPEHKVVEINHLIENFVKDFSADIRASKATIEFGDLPNLFGHSAQLRMIFQNLISNAIKFRKPDEAPNIKISAIPFKRRVIFEISDNGIGIPKEHQENVFGLFKKLHSRSSYDGSGLGLAICRRVMSNHGGSISIDSTVGVGTTFRLDFFGDLDD